MSDKNWILFVSPQIYPCTMGGIEVFNYYLINNIKKDYSLHLATYCKIDDFENVIVHNLKKSKFSKITSPILLLLFLIKNRKKIRLVYFGHARSYWTYWMVFILMKKYFGIKYGFTSHGGSLFKGKPKFPFRSLFKNAEFITGVSNRIIEENSKRSNRKIIFTPPLIPFKVISPKNKYRAKWNIVDNEKVLLYVGSLKPLKSVDTLIEALGIISLKKLKEYKLKILIAGDGVSRPILEKRVIELDLQDTVIFLGIVDRNNIYQLYNLADIYTICSEFEGLPISLLEAFANGLPCITSDAPGLVEISMNNKNTLLFKTKDTKDYAKKIEFLLNNGQFQNKLKLESHDYFKNNYSYEILVNRFRNLIDKI